MTKSDHQIEDESGLRAGMRLLPDEFMERYRDEPDLWAELLNGVVRVDPPRKFTKGTACGTLSGWLGYYAAYRDGVEGLPRVSLFLGEHRLQPDVLLMRRKGGTASVRKDGFVHGPPELICEVADDDDALEVGEKTAAYQANGVTEFIVWHVHGEQRLDWYVLDDGRYREITPDRDGILTSTVFPGLRLDRPALLRGDMAAVLVALS
ncbi:MAG: Uma2 family endonuclease [Planctomycetota bacterium]